MPARDGLCVWLERRTKHTPVAAPVPTSRVGARHVHRVLKTGAIAEGSQTSLNGGLASVGEEVGAVAVVAGPGVEVPGLEFFKEPNVAVATQQLQPARFQHLVQFSVGHQFREVVKPSGPAKILHRCSDGNRVVRVSGINFDAVLDACRVSERIVQRRHLPH